MRLNKKITAAILTAVMCIGLMSGCKTQDRELSDVPLIYTSFYAMYDFASEIAGDKAKVINLVPSGAEPHDYEPTVEDIRGIIDADVFVYSGSGMEHWVESVTDTISEGDVKIVEASKGMPVTLEEDPHVWLDPDNAAYEMEQIKNALCEVAPENAAYYEENYGGCIEKINELKTEYEAFKGDKRSVVVTHAAFGYLFHWLGLEQVSLEGFSGESDPTPAQMSEIIDFMKENNIKYIFAEELGSDKLAEAAAAEVGAEVLTLNPFEGGTKGYFEAMEENLQALKIALAQ